jgi:23S rRNA (guanine2445-N2)-methyltransferase / 23S rRNA (guanine2069-N7)-methyltransferase
MYVGYETDARVCQYARENIAALDLEESLVIVEGALDQEAKSTNAGLSEQGLVIANPPYGERLGDHESLKTEYRTLADTVRQTFPGWQFALLSNSRELFSETRLRADKSYRVMNGPIECELKLYSIKSHSDTGHQPSGEPALSEGAEMVANRLRKNLRKLKKWRENTGSDCYRIYDADLPEYAAAIDVYGKYVHVQEYKAPPSIDTKKANHRFRELCAAVKHVFELKHNELFTKVRKRNRGVEQYEKASDAQTQLHEVHEGQAKLLVNLENYLDTGLFLDHRLLRQRVGQKARGKRFLNLFSYTSTATVHAVLGGAVSSTSVDMSNTYSMWSRKNFELNNIRSKQHQIVRDDVLVWLKKCRQGFDLIMLDPPSFSNSKKMDQSFDVQRDHVSLVTRCMEILSPKGTLYFSNNLTSFKLDETLHQKYRVLDITSETIDLDFERNKKIHVAYKLEHR